MKKQKLLILGVLLLVFLFVIYLTTILLSSRKNGVKNPILPFFPTPTLYALPPQKKISPSPTLIPPAFTGADTNPEIPQEELNFSAQKYSLRRKTPLKAEGFGIFFDYSNDLFNVILEEPKETNQATFSAWLEKNYPLIPLNRFTFQ